MARFQRFRNTLGPWLSPGPALPVALTAGCLTPSQAQAPAGGAPFRFLGQPELRELLEVGRQPGESGPPCSCAPQGLRVAPRCSVGPLAPSLLLHQAGQRPRRTAMSTASQHPWGPRGSPGRLQRVGVGGFLLVKPARVPVLTRPLAGCVRSGTWLRLSESEFPPLALGPHRGQGGLRG